MPRVRVAACQINTVVGDLDGNAQRIAAALDAAEQGGADLAVFPELTITGYPPEDLLGRPAFVADNQAVFARVAAAAGRCAAVVGYVDSDRSGRLFNAAALCAEGQVIGRYRKRLLPNYGVFDEQRWFVPGDDPPLRLVVAGVPVGITICEDMWVSGGPMAAQAAAGARLLVNLNASPYSRGRREERLAVLCRARGGDRMPRRLREPGRWPGRAGVRRCVPGHGARWRLGGLGRPVRGRGAGGRRGR